MVTAHRDAVMVSVTFTDPETPVPQVTLMELPVVDPMIEPPVIDHA